MRFRSIQFITTLFFILSAPTINNVLGQSPLSTPKKVSVYYEASKNKVVVRWKKVSGASSYRISFFDTEGVRIAKGTTRNAKKKFSSGNFKAAFEYTVKVSADSGSTSSKPTSRSYTHKLSRAAGDGKLQTQNSFGRTGGYYLPPNFDKGPKPMMVAFHGQGAAGSSIVNAFSSLAKEFGFIIVAPSSGLTPEGEAAWEIGTEPNEFSNDFFHTQDCMEEVRGFKNVQIDPGQVLAIGYSAGGAVAPYFATNNEEFTHFAVLHGGTHRGGFGDKIIPGWYSTGINDDLRSPTELQGYITQLTLAGFNDLTFMTYDTDHGLAKEELRQVVKWWRGR
ncbi:MAG: hypothetical protein KDD70_08845 [Bdellovibrionales bacterium]|nr:hypothetical protein [Bdellovibrionales bacterium]